MFYLFDELIMSLFGNMSNYLWFEDFKTILLVICAFSLVYGAFALCKMFFSMGWLKW